LSPPDPETALKELNDDIWRIRNDVKSALTRWPYDPGLISLAVKLGVKA
jgi:hypothetical protein